MSHTPAPPVFLDSTGRRWRRIRGTALVLGVLSTIIAAALVLAVLIPPLLPVIGLQPDRELTHVPRWTTSRGQRDHLVARRRLLAALDRTSPPPATRAARLPSPARRGQETTAPPSGRSANPVVAGFYVNWDDNSFASLQAHADALDWVIGEWAFLDAAGDSVLVDVDRRVPYLLARLPAAHRPQALLMVSNYDGRLGKFDSRRLRALVHAPGDADRVARALAGAVREYGLGGVVIDFEEIPADVRPALTAFLRRMRSALDSIGPAGALGAAAHPLLLQAIGVDTPTGDLRAWAAVTDRTILMLYDEHTEAGDAGPVASNRWYEKQARAALAAVPAERLVLGIGTYGYDWNDVERNAPPDETTFQEVMSAARRSGRIPAFDSVSGNPYLTWTDPDSTDHVVWFLDAVTGHNEIVAGRRLGVAGYAIWRLGSEDPSLWRVVSRNGSHQRSPNQDDDETGRLTSLPAGYDVEFNGTGEVLNVTTGPTLGHRTVKLDPGTGRVLDEHYTKLPSPYVVARVGGTSADTIGARDARGGRQIALTFDDGPDADWTAPILDTLRARGAPATFFVIGANALSHEGLVHRIWREGHTVGNHTYTHPNLALTSPLVTRLEIDATERLLEVLLDRRCVFFRPPYFGDAEPTTAGELVPVELAGRLGYLTVGLHIDSEDWQGFSPRTIIDTVLAQRSRGHVVLLHDGGGDRSATVAALGPLIDSLRAHGDTIVPLAALAGLTQDQAMSPLPASSATARTVELAAFGALGALEWALFWLFTAAVVLGLGRLVVITVLAVLQRFRRRSSAGAHAATPYLPAVSVIVPAYNEEKVVTLTVTSLLTQTYPGALEIVVVDDGSTDRTYAVVRDAFEGDKRVTVLTKPNGGKASALNYGTARACGEIVVGLDADTVFLPDTVAELVAPLADARVGAVAGNAKVGNRINLVTRWQAVEYVTSQNLDRRAFALLDCITVVPGAVGAWRRDLVQRAGGFSNDTLAEDQDLTLAIRRFGFGIEYADRAVAYTEAPDTFRGLAKQRFRWSFGTLQCMWKHRDAFLRLRYGTLGMIAMPNVWLFQLVFAALSPLADLAFVWALASVWLTWSQHGATYAAVNLEQLLTLYAVFLFVDWAASVIAFLMESGEDRRLTWLILLQRFAYRQIMYWVVVRSFVAALRGRVVGWGTLDRRATVQLPS